jgi:hypothetical protein
MIDIKDLKVGQSVYVVKMGYAWSARKQELDKIIETKVAKVGRKYVTVGTGVTAETYDSQKDYKIYNGYGKVRSGLYLSVEDYFTELKKEKFLENIKSFFNDYSDKYYMLMDFEDLESINNIVKQY